MERERDRAPQKAWPARGFFLVIIVDPSVTKSWWSVDILLDMHL